MSDNDKIVYIDKKSDYGITLRPIMFYNIMNRQYNNTFLVLSVFDADKKWLVTDFIRLCKQINVDYKTRWEVRIKTFEKWDDDFQRYYKLTGPLLSARLGFHVAQYFMGVEMPVLSGNMFFEKRVENETEE